MTLENTLLSIKMPNEDAMKLAKRRLDNMAKPLNGLGLLEKFLIQLAGVQGTANVDISKKSVVVMCSDNGVVKQGVTQCDQDVTAIVTENLSHCDTTVCHMAEIAGADVFPVDIGVARDVVGDKILQKKIAYGTKDMTEEPAMTREQAIKAIETGIEIVFDLKKQGYNLIATGEMGIGNTTTSAAIASVLLDIAPEKITGRGSGLTSDGLKRKIAVIEKAIARHRPDKSDPIDVLSKVGGLDIAGLTGLYLGGAAAGVGIVMDGVISGVAALCAVRLCPAAIHYMLPSHMSAEPAGEQVISALGLEPIIYAKMALGEGTGAVAAFAIFDMAIEVYNKMCTFDDIKIEAYQPLV